MNEALLETTFFGLRIVACHASQPNAPTSKPEVIYSLMQKCHLAGFYANTTTAAATGAKVYKAAGAN